VVDQQGRRGDQGNAEPCEDLSAFFGAKGATRGGKGKQRPTANSHARANGP